MPSNIDINRPSQSISASSARAENRERKRRNYTSGSDLGGRGGRRGGYIEVSLSRPPRSSGPDRTDSLKFRASAALHLIHTRLGSTVM